MRIFREVRRIHRRRGVCQLVLEREKILHRAIEQQLVAQRQARTDRERIAVRRRIDDSQNASRIADDVSESAGRKPRVEW